MDQPSLNIFQKKLTFHKTNPIVLLEVMRYMKKILICIKILKSSNEERKKNLIKGGLR